MRDFQVPFAASSDSDPHASPRFPEAFGALVVAIGGLDPTGGAGLVRDFLTARTLGAHVRLLSTAWTDQSAATGVRSVESRQPEALARVVAAAIAAAPPRTSIKLGMMPTTASAVALREALRTFTGPIVFDPVLGASSGGALFDGDPRDLLPLAARASLVTPNAGEAERLTGERVADLEGAARAGRVLIDAGAPAVLIKGGHLSGGEAIDLLVTAERTRAFAAPRLAGPSVRGTGCALATAIAVALARGQDLDSAIGSAKAWLHEALQDAKPVGDEWHLS